MKVLLVDIDSRIPNLALMQISAWHKAQGDEVVLTRAGRGDFDTESPDKVYISCIFGENRAEALGMTALWGDLGAEVSAGGSGIGWGWLPEEMQKVKPDYDLYEGMDRSLGFTTRGCLRSCPWCVVPQKEGPLQRWQPLRDFHDDRFRKVVLLDNNILGDPEWFFLNTDFLLEMNLKVDINQGMDVRLLTPEICARLRELRWSGPLRFAFDSLTYEGAVRDGIRMLKEAGIRVWRSTIQFYVLVGHRSTPEEDVTRLRILKELQVQPFVMQYRRTPWTKRLAWWARAPVFWKTDLEDLDRQRYRSR
jgi:hypothetical protein